LAPNADQLLDQVPENIGDYLPDEAQAQPSIT